MGAYCMTRALAVLLHHDLGTPLKKYYDGPDDMDLMRMLRDAEHVSVTDSLAWISQHSKVIRKGQKINIFDRQFGSSVNIQSLQYERI
jgi:hypothetical protein